MWGTVGSGLTSGSRPDGRTLEIPEISGIIPEKTEISGKSRNLHVTYQMKALGKLVHVDTKNSRIPEISGKIREKLGKNAGNPYFCRPKGDHPASM